MVDNAEMKKSVTSNIDLLTSYLPKLYKVPGLEPLVKRLIARHVAFLRDGFEESPSSNMGKDYQQLFKLLSDRQTLSQSELTTFEIAVVLNVVPIFKQMLEDYDAHSVSR